jgi:hypothetical protein
VNKTEKKKMIAAGVLFTVAVVWLFIAFSPSSPSSSTPAPEPTPQQSAYDVLNKGDAEVKTTAAKSKKGKGLTGPVDPTLRLDLLAKLQEVKYEGTERNIFQFYTAPPPPPPAPVAQVFGPNLPLPPPPPAPPTPPTPIPLKFYGLASAPGVNPRKAFLQRGEEIFVATEGEVVDKQFKVVKINDTNVEMEDIKNNSKQRLPLQES